MASHYRTYTRCQKHRNSGDYKLRSMGSLVTSTDKAVADEYESVEKWHLSNERQLQRGALSNLLPQLRCV